MDELDQKILDLNKLDPKELSDLCSDVRNFLINACSITGGHIGANLAVVELTIALHRVFDSPTDAFIFDTGHIGYTHKLLTGRRKLFSTLNTFGGMNRFITPEESEHDLIEMSHAGTSLSIGLGLALSKKFDGDNSNTISVIGDGALAEGIALEALNHISQTNVNHLIIINDNGFAISPGSGAIHQNLKNLSMQPNSENNLFKSLGYKYSGPLDGHDLNSLIKEFENYKAHGGQKIVHIITEKGKGFLPAKNSPIRMHYSNSFDIETGKPKVMNPERPIASFATEAIIKCMANDEKIISLTAGTKYATDLDRVYDYFPERTLDPGMSEQHLISLGVGMTLKNFYPILNYQSTFLQRGYDQLMHDVAYTNRPIMILSSRSGFAGYDNPTHHGVYDLSYLKALPNIRIFYPMNCQRLTEVIEEEIANRTGPVIICYPYGFQNEFDFNPKLEPASADSIIVTTGNLASDYQKFKIENDIKNFKILPIEMINPINYSNLQTILNSTKRVIVAEEFVSSGGLGETIAALMTKNRIACEFETLALENKFYPGGTSSELRKFSKIDPEYLFSRKYK